MRPDPDEGAESADGVAEPWRVRVVNVQRASVEAKGL
jgi:hypothetical protein